MATLNHSLSRRDCRSTPKSGAYTPPHPPQFPAQSDPTPPVHSAFEDYRFNPISLKELPRLSCGVSLLTAFETGTDYLDWSLDTHGIYIQFPNPVLFPDPQPAPATSTTASYPSLSSLPKYDLPKPASNPQRLPVLLNATYLPDVALEQGWTKREAVESAIRKAGWNGEISGELLKSVRVTRYQSRKGELGYEEWAQKRNK